MHQVQTDLALLWRALDLYILISRESKTGAQSIQLCSATSDGADGLTEEQRIPRTQPARLATVRSLSASTKGPVRIMCIVVESTPGLALVQDIYDEVGKTRQIRALVEGKLEVAQKYMLIGSVTEKNGPNGKELMIAASYALNVNSLDIKEYKQALELEERIARSMGR
jgi:hypothetical protein